MTNSEKEKARRELAHALAALTDDGGRGNDGWGPGAIAARLMRREGETGRLSPIHRVFMAGWSDCVFLGRNGSVEQFASAMRKIAPVLLEVLLEDE